jgi:glycosyltransferase involved in cell wall biosynthesis
VPASAFVIPGDINLPTGGYAYDRQVLAGLAAHGVTVRHVALAGTFPSPAAADIQAAAAAFAALPADMPLLIDGLAYGAFPASLLREIRQPIIALVHHPLGLETGLTAARAAELIRLETAALAAARHVIVTSPLTKRLLIADFAVPADIVTVAEPGTDLAARSAGSGGSTLHLLAAGSIVPRKGYPVLMRALADLAAAGDGQPRWRLTVAGALRDPAEARRVETAAAALGHARVTLAGAVTDQQLEQLYQTADVFVMPSLFEGYGMVLAEAMARGLPIVCTTGGAAADTVPDGAGLKVAPGDAVALRQAVGRVLLDAPLRRRLADASWAAGTRLPRWPDTCRIIGRIIAQVSKGGHG